MDRKKILLIALFILSVFVFAGLLYYVFFRPLLSTSPGVNGNTNGTLPPIVNGNIPIVGNTNIPINLPGFGSTIDLTSPTDIARGGLTNVRDVGDQRVQDIVSGASGQIFYDKNASMFFKVEGEAIVPLSNKQFFNVDKVVWSQAQDKAIIEYPDGSKIIYDFTKNKQVTLPKEMTDLQFDPQGVQIAGKWIGKNDEDNWLMVGDTNAANFTLVEPIADQQHNVLVGYSPDNQVVALARKAYDATRQTITPIGLRGENFKAFNVDGLNFQSKWSPKGDTLLYSAASANNDYNPVLTITSGTVDTLGDSRIDLQLNTWPSKCTFDGQGTAVYCAVPTSLPRGAGLYPETAVGIPDVFYKIDLKTGQKIPLAIPVGSQAGYSAQTVTLSQDGSLLYFVDSQTNKLHYIRLK